MASIAVLPNLKRTITDIMEDELYHIPNSPVPFNGSGAIGQNTNSNAGSVANGFATQSLNATGSLNGSDSPRVASRNPSLTSSVGFNQFTLSQGMTSQFDSMFEQQRNMTMTPSMVQPVSFDSIQFDMFPSAGTTENNTGVNPFADYANPDSHFATGGQINNNNSYNNDMMSAMGGIPFHNAAARRRRLTTLDMTSNEKSMKDDDYYLFNTDIQPSLVSHDENVNEEFICMTPLYVPPVIQQDIRIPKFENDYLTMSAAEDFEEDMEDDTSDDDDNYFHDDFEEMLEKGDDYWQMNNPMNNQMNARVPSNDSVIPVNVMKDMNQFTDSQMTISMNSQDFPGNSNDEQEMILDDSTGDLSDDSVLLNTSHQSGNSNNSLNSSPSLSAFDSSSRPSISSLSSEVQDNQDKEKFIYCEGDHHHQTAAEITAVNPNHQCDLINPSTNKPCNKQFSRPYDLIRHHETIHAAKKKIFRCVICEGRYNGGRGNGKLKTFSRGDALSRHIKVKHGLVGEEALDLINEAKANVEFVSV